MDHRKKYILPSGEKDSSAIKKDLIKIISSLGIGEVVYNIMRWFLQYYLLTGSFDAYLASLVSQATSTVVYIVVVNFSVKLTGLYKNDT